MQVTGYVAFIKYLVSIFDLERLYIFLCNFIFNAENCPKDFLIYILTFRITYVIYNSSAQREKDLLVGRKKTNILGPKSISPLGFYNCLIINEILFFKRYLLVSVLKLKHYISRL